ncbi:MAG: hypothetical protein Q9164_006471 [Protoblastenia rupestris]
MPLRRKIGVSAIFATGAVAIIASVLGLYYRIEDIHGSDPFWDALPVLLLAVIEMSVAVMCGCMPYLAAFFRRHHPNLSFASSLKYFFTQNSNHSSRSKKNIPIKTFHRVESNPSDKNVLVEKDVHGPNQGNDTIINPENFHKEWWPVDSTLTNPNNSHQDVPTHRGTWE